MISRVPKTSQRLAEREALLERVRSATVLQWLIYPAAYAIARPFYRIGLGKIFLRALRLARLFPAILAREEKAEGNMSPRCRRLPNACASLARHSLRRLHRSNARRRALVAYYAAAARERGWPVIDGIREDLPLQKFPLFVANARDVRAALKRRNVFLDDGWTGCVVCPADVDAACANYAPGSDPAAERAAASILSLPAHPTMTLGQARRLIRLLAPLLEGRVWNAEETGETEETEATEE